MASTWSKDGIDYVAASVSEFTGVIGYCEYEAPMVLQQDTIVHEPSKAIKALRRTGIPCILLLNIVVIWLYSTQKQ